MNYVEPIRDLGKLNDMCGYLQKTNERNHIMFMMGIYSGLRISDILKVRIRDVFKKSAISIREEKTGKQRIIPIHAELRKALEFYCSDKDPDEYLVKSRQQYNKAITRDMALKIIKSIGELFDVPNLGCHSMRKTFGYQYYKTTGDIETLRKIFGHSHFVITLRYIGCEQENINKAILDIKY